MTIRGEAQIMWVAAPVTLGIVLFTLVVGAWVCGFRRCKSPDWKA